MQAEWALPSVENACVQNDWTACRELGCLSANKIRGRTSCPNMLHASNSLWAHFTSTVSSTRRTRRPFCLHPVRPSGIHGLRCVPRCSAPLHHFVSAGLDCYRTKAPTQKAHFTVSTFNEPPMKTLGIRTGFRSVQAVLQLLFEAQMEPNASNSFVLSTAQCPKISP